MERAPIIYDDAAWHYRGPFPPELPCEAGAICPGMFLTWAILSGLGSNRHGHELQEKLANRFYLPGQYLVQICGEKLTETDLNPEGNAFASKYLQELYPKDYLATVCIGIPSLYHVEDSWENFEKLRPVLNRRLKSWRREHSQPGFSGKY